MKFKYNLQFFGDDEDEGNAGRTDTNNLDDGNGSDNNEPSLEAFADIISEKDKRIEQLEKDVAELKKSNANLLVRVNSGNGGNEKKSFEENLLGMVGYKPRKE